MGAKKLSDIFNVGADVLGTSIDATTKTILAQIGSVTEEYSHGDNAEWWQHVGFASRPGNPIKGKSAAQCVAATQSARDVIFASRDIRSQTIYGNLKEGETCVYAAGPEGTAQARILLKADGSINLYTKQGNTESGGGMAIMITPSSDMISIINSKGYGLIIDSTGVKLTAGSGAALTLTSSSAKLISTGNTQIDGGGIVLGSLAVPGVNSALKGVSGALGTASLKTLIE